jgi:hypothetical protein
VKELQSLGERLEKAKGFSETIPIKTTTESQTVFWIMMMMTVMTKELHSLILFISVSFLRK